MGSIFTENTPELRRILLYDSVDIEDIQDSSESKPAKNKRDNGNDSHERRGIKPPGLHAVCRQLDDSQKIYT